MDQWIKSNKIFLFIYLILAVVLYYLGRKNLLNFQYNTWVTAILFLVVLIGVSSRILKLNENRNAGDVLFFNSTLAVLALFMIGIIANDVSVWKFIVISLAIVATGEKIVGYYIK